MRFKCLFGCGYAADKWNAYKSHCRSHLSTFCCPLCGREFVSQPSLLIHFVQSTDTMHRMAFAATAATKNTKSRHGRYAEFKRLLFSSAFVER